LSAIRGSNRIREDYIDLELKDDLFSITFLVANSIRTTLGDGWDILYRRSIRQVMITFRFFRRGSQGFR